MANTPTTISTHRLISDPNLFLPPDLADLEAFPEDIGRSISRELSLASENISTVASLLAKYLDGMEKWASSIRRITSEYPEATGCVALRTWSVGRCARYADSLVETYRADLARRGQLQAGIDRASPSDWPVAVTLLAWAHLPDSGLGPINARVVWETEKSAFE